MALNLRVDRDLGATAQAVKDQNDNASPLALSTDKVGIGTTEARSTLDVVEFGRGQNPILILRRDESSQAGDPALNVSFILDPTNHIFHLDVSGQKNAQARIHLGDLAKDWNPVTTMGKVGIGTVNPRSKLEVHGDIRATGDVILSGADCAEEFDVEEDQAVEPGTVMVIGDEDKLRRCTEAYDKRVLGVLSGACDYKPGIILDRQQSPEKRMPLALTGKVFCKVDAQYGAIGVGDLLTTSPTPGHAMQASDPLKAFGAVLGKALGALDAGKGLIPILVALQ